MVLNQKLAWTNILTTSLWLVALLVLFFYGEHTGETVSAYFLFFPLLAGALTYLFSQGIYTLVLCNRKINSDEE